MWAGGKKRHKKKKKESQILTQPDCLDKTLCATNNAIAGLDGRHEGSWLLSGTNERRRATGQVARCSCCKNCSAPLFLCKVNVCLMLLRVMRPRVTAFFAEIFFCISKKAQFVIFSAAVKNVKCKDPRNTSVTAHYRQAVTAASRRNVPSVFMLSIFFILKLHYFITPGRIVYNILRFYLEYRRKQAEEPGISLRASTVYMIRPCAGTLGCQSAHGTLCDTVQQCVTACRDVLTCVRNPSTLLRGNKVCTCFSRDLGADRTFCVCKLFERNLHLFQIFLHRRRESDKFCLSGFVFKTCSFLIRNLLKKISLLKESLTSMLCLKGQFT